MRYAQHFTVQHHLVQMALHMKRTRLDCSHLVHELYARAGLNYRYATSRRLYRGMHGFERVRHPEAGDLVIWRGHVGIVVDPAKRSFVSALRGGVKLARYNSPYWRRRGVPRFLRYELPLHRDPEFWVTENYIHPEVQASSSEAVATR